jgi:hypothetical protein
LVPRIHGQALEINEKNGNTKWQGSIKKELEQLAEYKTFFYKGVGGEAPAGYKKIRRLMIYDVKHEGRHKCRLVAGGHLTDRKKEIDYSGVMWNSTYYLLGCMKQA